MTNEQCDRQKEIQPESGETAARYWEQVKSAIDSEKNVSQVKDEVSEFRTNLRNCAELLMGLQ